MFAASPPPPHRTRWAFALCALLASAASACVIGPKQDDPAAIDYRGDPDASMSSDTAAFDGTTGVFDDSGAPDDATATPSPDGGGGDAADADEAGDARDASGCGDADPDAGDACATGGGDAISAD